MCVSVRITGMGVVEIGRSQARAGELDCAFCPCEKNFKMGVSSFGGHCASASLLASLIVFLSVELSCWVLFKPK